MCRIHYLLVVKADKEFNEARDELINFTGDKGIIKTLIVFQILLSPILAPLSMLKRLYNLFFKKK